MSQGIKNQIGPFMHADGATRRRTAAGTDFIVGIAGAYNAFGLIGPEHNGIFVLNDTEKRVVMDRHCEQLSGYNGPSVAQWDALAEVMKMTDIEFVAFVTSNPRFRGII